MVRHIACGGRIGMLRCRSSLACAASFVGDPGRPGAFSIGGDLSVGWQSVAVCHSP